MTIGNPRVTVWCNNEKDSCPSTVEFDLRITADGSWDLKQLPIRLDYRGWIIDGSLHYCNKCKRKMQGAKQEQPAND